MSRRLRFLPFALMLASFVVPASTAVCQETGSVPPAQSPAAPSQDEGKPGKPAEPSFSTPPSNSAAPAPPDAPAAQDKQAPAASPSSVPSGSQEPPVGASAVLPEVIWSPVRAASPATPEDEVVVAAVGDIMLGSTFPDSTGGSLPPEDGVHLLDEMAPFLKGADLAIGNLEGPLYDGPEPSAKCLHKAEGTCYAFKVPTRYAKLLADAGFVAMGLANNHAKDFGTSGQQSTIAALTSAGIAQSGATGVVAHLLVKGKKVSYIAFATYPQFNNALDIKASTALVQAEAKLTDLVIVSFHGGAEGADRQHVPVGHEMFLGEDRGDLRTFTHAMVDAGAALVFGHGPHVVRGMELYKGHLIAYSLGNFATYGHVNLRGVNGLTLVLSARLGSDGKFLGGTIHPGYQLYPGGPHVDAESPAVSVINVVQSLSKADFAATAVTVNEHGAILAPEIPPVPAKDTTARPVVTPAKETASPLPKESTAEPVVH